MDRVMRVLLAMLVITCGAAVCLFAFEAHVDSRYTDTLESSYQYRVTVGTDGPLDDLHLFLPLPEREGGSSEVVRAVGAGGWTEIPEGWNVTLTGTEKFTLLEVRAPSVSPTAECGACGNGGALHTFTVPVKVSSPVETADPVADDEALAPRGSETGKTCLDTYSPGDSAPRCTAYETRFFADYTAYPATTVVISVELTGTNRWNIFEERWSGFRDTASLTVLGESHGWQTARGEMESGLGYSSLW